MENSSLSYATNAVNQYDKDEYDQSGNQTLLHTGGYTWHVQYNAENRPVLFRRERNMAEEPEVSLIMKYDSRGRRTVKTAFVDGVMADSRKFVYDEFLLVAELRSRNAEESGYALHQTFLWDPAETVATRPLCMTCWRNGVHEEESNASLDYTLECFNKKQTDVPFWVDETSIGRYFYIEDHNKNVKGIMNYMGELLGEYDYSPFGKMVISSSNGIVSGNPFRFSSEYYDRELGLVYYNYRHYNPMEGCWISRDSIGEEGGNNLYSFVGNNGVNDTDKLGLTINMSAAQYDTLSNIINNYGVLAYIGDSNKVDWPRPKEEDEDEFETKKMDNLYCARVKKAKRLTINVKTVLPSDWGNPTNINDKMFAFSKDGYDSTVKHEFRRRCVYTRANKSFLVPAETSGNMATKCGWICCGSYATAKSLLSDYLDALRTEAKSQYSSYVAKEQSAIGDEDYNSGYEDWGLGFQVYVINEMTNIHNIEEPNPSWNTKYPLR